MVAEGIASIVVAPFCLSSFMVRILQYEERLAKKRNYYGDYILGC